MNKILNDKVTQIISAGNLKELKTQIKVREIEEELFKDYEKALKEERKETMSTMDLILSTLLLLVCTMAGCLCLLIL